jgi:hypothetical protein
MVSSVHRARLRPRPGVNDERVIGVRFLMVGKPVGRKRGVYLEDLTAAYKGGRSVTCFVVGRQALAKDG